MAADTYTAPQYNEPALLSRGAVIVRCIRVVLTDLVGAAGSTIAAGLLEDDDVIKLMKLPPDVKILWARADLEDVDSGTQIVWDLQVYNGTTTKYLFKDATAGQAINAVDSRAYSGGTGALMKFTANSALGYVIPGDNYYVRFVVTTAPAGAGGATPSVEFEVAYTSQLESGEATFRA